MRRAKTCINIKHVTRILVSRAEKLPILLQQLLRYKSSSKVFHDDSIQTKDLSVTEFILLLASSQFWTIGLYLEIRLDYSRDNIKVSQDWEK